MEWVETTGRTVDDAKEAALDQLGVDARDAEFEVVEEPRTGLFGRMRGEARVRARVRPMAPRPKAERRDRRRRRTDGQSGQGRPAEQAGAGGGAETIAVGASTGAANGPDETAKPTGGASPGAKRRRSRSGSGPTQNRAAGNETEGASTQEGSRMPNDVTVDEQATIMRTFLDGLVEAFDFDATIMDEKIDDETIELRVDGEDLGLLIGPKGQTLQAVQELARTVVQRQATGTHHGRVRIDVAGYRQRRREALERFTQQVAADVLSSGVPKALEPMHPADRKVVHDVVNELEGVATTSEGEEPNRRVVIVPSATDQS
ncbi:MAG TPA: RNA-binding cell elongation regulator Jag/EloR [Acidimicrobiales bacterium]|nr:RNA-binding cell elongation regulator Jag/EloR [Acidimicrobiales bacterium]